MGIETAKLDAKVLLNFVLEKDEAFLFKHEGAPVTNCQHAKYMRYIKRRLCGEPVAYITHKKEFYGLDFYINKNVLIPRPETELLSEQALKFIKLKVCKVHKVKKSLNIIDVGTGSGCIIISIIKSLEAESLQPRAKFYATDISKKALYVAKKNAKKHGVVDKIKFYHSDLFSNKRLPKKYDVIIANLPYVPSSNIRNLPDPKIALDGGHIGTDIIKKLISRSSQHLEDDGVILLEIGFNQTKDINQIVRKYLPGSKIKTTRDLSGFDRIIAIRTESPVR
jgi:release factor glutamine methyltransferase